MRCLIYSWLAAVCVLPSAPPEGKAQVSSDKKDELSGKWVVVTERVDGKPVTTTGSSMLVSFTGNKCSLSSMEGTYTLKTTTNPKEIDLTFSLGDGKTFTLAGIYEVGDQLRLCLQGKDRQRPDTLVTKAGDGRQLYDLKRFHELDPGVTWKGACSQEGQTSYPMVLTVQKRQ